ncbi:nucleotidyltransferase family protein [Methylomonas sp. YC3]
MKALLLAAGFGTRLRPITDTIPKCLVPIHGKPLLGYWLDLLLPAVIERALINTHYLPDVVREYVSKSSWREKVDLVHEDRLLGTGGTVLVNRDYFGRESFFVAHADNLTRFDPNAFIQAHANRRQGTLITMMTFDTDVPQSCGIVELDGDGLVVAFHEKKPNPPGRRASAAVYLFEPEVVDFMLSLGTEEFDISMHVIPYFLGKIQTFHNADYHRDIGSPESLRLAEIEF